MTLMNNALRAKLIKRLKNAFSAGRTFDPSALRMVLVDIRDLLELVEDLRVPSSSPSVSRRFGDLHGPGIALPCAQRVAQQFLNFLPLPQGQ